MDFDDVIPFGDSSCRDWVAHVKYPALTKKKKRVVINPTNTDTGEDLFDPEEPSTPLASTLQMQENLNRTSTPDLLLG